MENATALDSNSESDISDSWALIDEDSSLEWNSEMGLSPRKFILEKNEVPRTNSRNEFSDEDSIEVVAEDHTDCLNDNEAEGLKDNQQSIGLPENVNVLPEMDESNTIPIVAMPKVQDVPDHPITVTEYKSTPAIIVLFLMGIVGGIAVGYSLALFHQPSEDSTSIQNTRALLAKLQNENLFLQQQLHCAQSFLRKAVANVPEFKEISELSVHKKHITDYTGTCKITDFILQSHFTYNNFSSDVCPSMDKPLEDSGYFSMNKIKENDAFTLLDDRLSSNQMETLNSIKNKSEQNPKEEIHTLQTDKNSVPIEGPSAIPGMLFNEHLYQKNATQDTQSSESKLDNTDVKSNETGNDPRPFTKARSIVEKMYNMLSMLGHDVQTSFPPKLKLLSILSQDDLDLSLESISSDNYNTIVAFKKQMQLTAQKMLNNIESSINTFVRHISNKFKKFEMNNKKQICKLKRKLENSPDKDQVDWNQHILQGCVDYQQNGHNDAKHKNSQMKVNDSLLKRKDSMQYARATLDHKKANHVDYIEENQAHVHDTYHPNENKKHTSSVKENSEANHEKTGKSSKYLPEFEKKNSEKVNLKKYESDVQANRQYIKHKHKQVQPDKQIPKKKWKEDGHDTKEGNGVHDKMKIFEEKEKKVSKMSTSNDFNNRKHEKYNKKAFEEKEKKIENNKDNKKKKDKIVHEDDANKSGEWMQKMAHGRAEQRRREHQSDWLFDRAESRKSSRGKERRNAYWYERQDYSEKVFMSDMYNKTKAFKDQASKSWKDMKHHVKENVWRPIVDTAKTAKRVLNNFNYYRCQRE